MQESLGRQSKSVVYTGDCVVCGVPFTKVRSRHLSTGIPTCSRFCFYKARRLKLVVAKDETHLDESIFAEWSPVMAYFVGFLTADGFLHSTQPSVSFNSTEVDELLKFKQILRFTGDVKVYKSYSRGVECKPCGKLVVWSRLLRARLGELGLHPRKTYGDPIPVGLPDHLFYDYLRGLFDGDGCLSFGDYSNCSAKYCRFSIASKSRVFLFWLLGELRNRGFTGTVGDVRQREFVWSNLTLGKTSTLCLMPILYRGPAFDLGLRFEYKYQKWLRAKEHFDVNPGIRSRSSEVLPE